MNTLAKQRLDYEIESYEIPFLSFLLTLLDKQNL